MTRSVLLGDGKILAGPGRPSDIAAEFKATAARGGDGFSILEVCDLAPQKSRKFDLNAKPEPAQEAMEIQQAAYRNEMREAHQNLKVAQTEALKVQARRARAR